MENNHLINKVNSIIMASKSESDFSLFDFISLIEKIKKEKNLLYKNTIKKMNNKLGNNISLFDYTITAISINENINLTLECNVIRERIEIDKENLKVLTKFKNKETLENLINSELTDLLEKLKEYDYLNKIKIKTKFEDLNINIEPKFVELFAYKSPNWITMGKSFSLKYIFDNQKYLYEIDHINIKEALNNQEKLLFSKINIDFNLLSNELKTKYYEYQQNKTEKEAKKDNIFTKFFAKIRNLLKKD